MSEPEASQAGRADGAEKKPSAAKPQRPFRSDAGPAANEGSIWAQSLAIAVIVTAASAWLLSEREQEPTTEVRSATQGRAAPVEEPDLPDQMPEAEDAPAPVRASASAHEPAIERQEPSPE
jgi:hypothetical protein